MAEVKIEIGENLAKAIQAFTKSVSEIVSKSGGSVGLEVQRAFGIDVTRIAKEKILMDTALEKGLDIQFENDSD